MRGRFFSAPRKAEPDSFSRAKEARDLFLRKNDSLIIGTRGSALALAQTNLVVSELKRTNTKGMRFEVQVIKTAGDDLYRKPNALTGKDAFTGAIDRALGRGEIDLSVHSLKDVPTMRRGLVVAAYPRRDSPFDALVCKKKSQRLSTLPRHARIGTSSVRRAVQLRAYRPDFEIVEIHGNVQTRLGKLRDSEEEKLDALVLAEAGLNRLKLEREISEVLPHKVMLPAAGQGCLAVTVRSDDQKTLELVSKIDDKKTRSCVEAERSFSTYLGAGCNLPIAALATFKRSDSGGSLLLRGLIATGSDKNLIVKDSASGKNPEDLGRELAERMRAMT